MPQQINIQAAEAEISTAYADLMNAADKLPPDLAASLRSVLDDLSDVLDDVETEASKGVGV